MVVPAAGFVARLVRADGVDLGVEYSGRRLDYRPGWFVTRVKGLTDGAAVTPTEIPRDRSEGQLDLPNELNEARVIEIGGIAYADSAYELERMQLQQGALLALRDDAGELHWRGKSRTWLRTHVRRGRGWEFTPTPSPRRATFLHRFRAPSQLIYEPPAAAVVGVAVTVENRGFAPTVATITVTGNMPDGYRIDGPGGRVYQVTGGLTAGHTDVLDMREGLVVRDGALASGIYGARIDVWEIPPGRTQMTLVPVSGAGQMSVVLSPAHF